MNKYIILVCRTRGIHQRLLFKKNTEKFCIAKLLATLKIENKNTKPTALMF